jgi:hypothetical protein
MLSHGYYFTRHSHVFSYDSLTPKRRTVDISSLHEAKKGVNKHFSYAHQSIF